MIAVVIALVAVFANKAYISSELDKLRPKKTLTLVRAKNPIQAGDQLRAKDVDKVQDIPLAYAPKVAIAASELDSYLGQELTVDVPAGDYILENYFTVRRAVGNKLSDQVEGENFRAITLPVDQTNSLAGSIVTGDKVDLAFTFTVAGVPGKLSTVLLQNVPVIATGSYSVMEQEVGDRGGRAKRYNSLTLLLSAYDAHRLNFARQVGKIDILLRNAKDNANFGFTPISNVTDVLTGPDKELVERLIQSSSEGKLSEADKEAVKNQLREMFQNRSGRPAK